MSECDAEISIGMATYDDYDGVYFTITSCMLHHPQVMQRCQFVVVDNNPKSAHGRSLRRWVADQGPRVEYFEFIGPPGTAQPRNEVFRRARAPFVLCMDCHVLLAPESISRLLQYYKRHPDSRDLLTGPLLNDAGMVVATHQTPKWSQGAFGVWDIDKRGLDSDHEPFEIWQQGMGVFSCRKDAWVEFHPDFRGFGGCESYVMEKVRRQGGRVLCCPWLRWTHRFERPHGPAYQVSNRDRQRNYVIGFTELGLPIEPVLRHFKTPYNSADIPHLDAAPASHEIKIVGAVGYGSVRMRGVTLANHLGVELVGLGDASSMHHCQTIVALKGGFCAKTLRSKSERLIYDPLDVFANAPRSVRAAAYWRECYEKLRFDDIIATSPACLDVMRNALPAKVGVHLVPHHSDASIDSSWHCADGPIVYSGLEAFIRSKRHQIEDACARVGRPFLSARDHRILRGSALALSLRLPPHNTELNRRCKPQIKLANAAAASIPVVSTDCPSAVSLYPDLKTVRADFSTEQLVAQIDASLQQGPHLVPFYEADYLAAMDRILKETSVREHFVVYTAVFGGRDHLRTPRELVPGVRYVCYSDNPHLSCPGWEMRYQRPSSDPHLQAKKLKILAHEVLDCEISLWVDGSVELLKLNIDEDMLTSNVALRAHPSRNCVYEEALHCKRTRRGDPAKIDRAINRYHSEGHPQNHGLWLGGIVLRKHCDETQAFNEAWWQEVNSGTRRDQISLPVVLRRLGIAIDALPENAPTIKIHHHRR